VLVQQEGIPRGQWKLGRVTKLLDSVDGSIRAAELHTPSGRQIQRPLCHLYPLEIPSDSPPARTQQPQTQEDDQQPRTTKQADTQRPRRQAAEKARERVRQWSAMTVFNATLY